ncbi:MAG: lysophospholipid acyltransferase family protein [Pyrinomonadaceae bacterium]
MSKPKLQIELEYGVARFVLAIFASMPLRLAMRTGAGLAVCFSWFAGRLRRTGERNLEIAFPELSAGERRLRLRHAFGNLGRLLGAFSHFGEDSERLRELVVCEGLDHLQNAQAAGGGVILFTGHVGAWELSSFALSLFGHPLSFLVRRMDNPKIEAIVDRARTHLGNRTIDKRSAAREMLGTLQGGGTLGILVDLNTLDREGIFVDFFGRAASTTFLVAKLALRTGAAVLPVFAPWDHERDCFLLKVDAPLSIERTGNEEADVRCLTQQYTGIVENYVRRYPDQWLWIHRRWQTRPPGEPEIYSR